MISSLTSSTSSTSNPIQPNNQRKSYQQLTKKTSEQIQLEIQRFESVHPYIYQVYDLIDRIKDSQIQDELRDQVVCIEG